LSGSFWKRLALVAAGLLAAELTAQLGMAALGEGRCRRVQCHIRSAGSGRPRRGRRGNRPSGVFPFYPRGWNWLRASPASSGSSSSVRSWISKTAGSPGARFLTLPRTGVEKGYPLLVKAGRELAAGGVKFYDARKVFAGIEEPRFIDQCCHFNQQGNRILAAWMAARIVQDLSAAPADRSRSGH
jgi:hypothetical protein